MKERLVPENPDQPPVPSPCRQICQLDEDEVCVGCGRTIVEIATWTQMSDDEKQAVLDRLSAEME